MDFFKHTIPYTWSDALTWGDFQPPDGTLAEGIIDASSINSLTDSTALWDENEFANTVVRVYSDATNYIYGVVISNSDNTLVFDTDFSANPTVGQNYEILPTYVLETVKTDFVIAINSTGKNCAILLPKALASNERHSVYAYLENAGAVSVDTMNPVPIVAREDDKIETVRFKELSPSSPVLQIRSHQWEFPHWDIISSGSGSGGGALSVESQGTLIGSASTINFMGSEIVAFQEGSKIVVQVPPSNYAANLFVGDASVGNVATSNRNVSSPTAEGTPFKIGDWTGGTVKPTTQSGSWVYQTNASTGFFTIANDTATVFTAQVLDADDTTVIAENSVTITGNEDQTLQNIRVEVYDFAPDADRFKAKLRVTINLAAILPEGGRFSVNLSYNNDGDIRTKNQSNVFYDTNPIAPTINNPTFSENTAVVNTLSGVRSYGDGSTFNVAVTNINNINNRSYPSNFIAITGAALGLPLLSVQGASLTGWTNAFDNTGASYTNATWTLANPNYFNKGDIGIQARWVDWVNGAWQPSLTEEQVISTYVDNSTRIFEDFRTESRRLLANYSTAWDSNESLDTADGGVGLQAENSLLVYPQDDYSTFKPNEIDQPNYTALDGDRVWRSHFYFTNVSKSNGIFRFADHNITETDITTKEVEILISLDKVNWFTLGDDYGGGYLADGDGCRINPGEYNMSNNRLRFTLGTSTFTDASSDWGIWFQIKYKSTSKDKFLGSFELIDWV